MIEIPVDERSTDEWLLGEQHLVDLYIFADRRDVQKLRNDLITMSIASAEIQHVTRGYRCES